MTLMMVKASVTLVDIVKGLEYTYSELT